MTTEKPDPRQLIARLAVALLLADGRVSPHELDAIERLDALGLGPLADFAEAELRHARHEPIDVTAAAAALAGLSPAAAAVILTVLAEIAASDGTMSHGEVAVLNTVASRLGIAMRDAAHIVEAALAAHGATLAEGPEALDKEPQRPRLPVARVLPRRPVGAPGVTAEPMAADLERAQRMLGVAAGASHAEVEAAYAGLVARYDPAKVVALGGDFAALAVHKLYGITRAFETVCAARTRGG